MNPLVPPEVDLRDFPYTPILRARLFGSGFHARSTDSEWRAGVTLWLKAWEQVPAGSLPSDEIEQCRLAELGRDFKTWRKIRAGALRGWALASDGLLYHGVLSIVVLEAWIEKLGQQLSGGAGNAKRWGIEFDAGAIQAQIAVAIGMLFALDPQSRLLRKKRHAGIPTGSKERPVGTAAGNPNGTGNHPNGSPDTIASEVKRSEGIENRDVGVTPTDNARPQADATGNGAVENIANSKAKANGAGQNWKSPAYVVATANNLGMERRQGEGDDDFKDRVYTAVQHRTAGVRA